jgi:hypothetical protein
MCGQEFCCILAGENFFHDRMSIAASEITETWKDGPVMNIQEKKRAMIFRWPLQVHVQ